MASLAPAGLPGDVVSDSVARGAQRASACFHSVGHVLLVDMSGGGAFPPELPVAGDEVAGFDGSVLPGVPFCGDFGVSGLDVVDAHFEFPAGAD